MKVRRLHAGLVGVLIPAVLTRLYVDEQRMQESLVVAAIFNLNETRQADQVDLNSIQNTSQHVEELDKSQQHDWIHRNVSSYVDMNDLDSTQKASCGFIKCYFRSKSDTQIGYVVAPMTRQTAGRLKSLTNSWKFAEQLRQEHDVHHFLLAPPTTAVVNQKLFVGLNQNLWSERSQKYQRFKRFRKGSTVVVQKVMAAPKQRILLGCAPPKLRIIRKQLDKFIRKSVKDKDSFARRFHESFSKIRELLRHEPCLIDDFQVFLDAKGNLHHLDIDRCFNAKTTKKKNERLDIMRKSQCYKTSLDKIEQNVYLALKKSGWKKQQAAAS